MYIFAYAMQLLALLCALGGAGMALIQLWQGRANWLHLIEKAHWLVSGALLLASALLLHALFWQADFLSAHCLLGRAAWLHAVLGIDRGPWGQHLWLSEAA